MVDDWYEHWHWPVNKVPRTSPLDAEIKSYAAELNAMQLNSSDRSSTHMTTVPMFSGFRNLMALLQCELMLWANLKGCGCRYNTTV
jgi:NifU-like protein involved in Fe-S cluster formation